MKQLLSILTATLISFSSTLYATSNTFLDYQNYNHGYCPDCNCCPCTCGAEGGHAQNDPIDPPSDCPTPDPCCPPATAVCTECGIYIGYIGLGIAALVTAAVFIVGSHNGSASHSSP